VVAVLPPAIAAEEKGDGEGSIEGREALHLFRLNFFLKKNRSSG
jgi:hypothetical protein